MLKKLSNQQNDSLKLLLPDFLAKAKTTQNNCALAWGYLYTSETNQSKKTFLNKALKEVPNCSIDQRIRLYSLLGSAFNYSGDNISALVCYTKVDQLTTDPDELFSNGLNKANIFLDRDNYEEASSILKKSKQFISDVPRESLYGYYSLRGYIYLNQNQLDTAKYFYSEALNIAQSFDNKRDIILAQQNIGIIESELGNITIAENTFLKNLELSIEINAIRNQMFAYNDLSLLYFQLKDYDRSLSMAKKHLDLASELNNTCLLYTSPSPRDATLSRMPSSA